MKTITTSPPSLPVVDVELNDLDDEDFKDLFDYKDFNGGYSIKKFGTDDYNEIW